ncbi:MAG: hypothetical protein U0174_08110 [Polyangiaceae bacterium]
MAAKSRKPKGIAPKLLLEQVKATAAWALDTELALPAAAILNRAPELDARWRKGEAGEDYFVFLLAAHFTTVATFCPTDVDVRIRQLEWASLEGKRLASAIERVEEVARWDVRPVTARHVVCGKEVLSGHQGEWFSVMAGALGRALALGDAALVERAQAWIEAELAREAKLVTRARERARTGKGACIQELLSVATTVTHNLGDLSRVVETWRPAHAGSDLGRRYSRLTHEDPSRFAGVFVYAGELNKQFMAKENHRFLPLRSPRALRREREFILPFGPYFYEWGRMIGSTPKLDEGERAEILGALLNMHERRTDEYGCLRAIAGMSATVPGGIERLRRLLPQSAAAGLALGGVQLALRERESDFLSRFHGAVPVEA